MTFVADIVDSSLFSEVSVAYLVGSDLGIDVVFIGLAVRDADPSVYTDIFV